MRYAIKEMFFTLQGEGLWSGAPSVFIRFSGCNLWSGREETREQDAEEKGACAAWCDTQFVGIDGDNGGKYTSNELVERAKKIWKEATGGTRGMRAVLTGGEPGLQLRRDHKLIPALQGAKFSVHMETNGTIMKNWKGGFDGANWVTVSPKPGAPVYKKARYDEIKVVYDGTERTIDPAKCLDIPVGWRFLQPLDSGDDEQNERNLAVCLEYVTKNPQWALSLQTHKIIGLP